MSVCRMYEVCHFFYCEIKCMHLFWSTNAFGLMQSDVHGIHIFKNRRKSNEEQHPKFKIADFISSNYDPYVF